MPSKTLLNVTITVSPENTSKFLEALKPCWEKVTAESECLFFDVFQDPTKPGRFKFLEVWSEDRKWFEEVQMKKAYYVPYVEVTVPMYTEERMMEFYEREEGWFAFKDAFLNGARRTG